ncbi:hypothetical protein BO86DRAFT_138870 [Aspergillus japonicus CBS 114.51]|uniref:Uncharacterized protein n=1 Tax=Aspergillus japonicus CBS 114.51 TaxID=1448312 RepID=A0A8T8XDF5_ASPJA|nr:hypothetical protein BO86DRAFT_138870 [Aspergillus japonicus CBS 114.51]RAH86061.1 hypothetical protein BO86DRAFT_138870 [Aspergillus japonicus CBS 114.51]
MHQARKIETQGKLCTIAAIAPRLGSEDAFRERRRADKITIDITGTLSGCQGDKKIEYSDGEKISQGLRRP